MFINIIVLLLRVSGGTWPCKTPATAQTSDVLNPTVLIYELTDEKMCGSSSYLRRAILFVKK